MDYQYFVDHVKMPCCVMSAAVNPDGSYGEIRIICANAAYRATMGPAYYDNMIYSELVPQDNKFEDYVYRAALQGQRMHAYVETKALNCWTDQTMIPLESDREDMGYCQFIFEFTREAEADRRSSLSLTTAEAVVRACINLMGNDDFQTRVGDVLDVIMDTAEAKGSRIMLIDYDHERAVNFCERMDMTYWIRLNPGVDMEKDNISYDLIRSWETVIGVSNALIIQNEQDMDDVAAINPGWADSMRQTGVENLVLIPLRRDDEILGYMYVVNFNPEKVVEVKELTELMAFFLGSELYSFLLLEKLEKLSNIDVLTGISNRRAMTNRMKRINERIEAAHGGKYSFGIISIDLNGLKVANDRYGHEAGDRMLVTAAEILSKVFYQDDLFRTGGDEFIVITDNIELGVFERKIRRLRADVEKNGEVSFSLGSCWSDGSTDLVNAFRIADERMYDDKRAFYEVNPSLRR